MYVFICVFVHACVDVHVFVPSSSVFIGNISAQVCCLDLPLLKCKVNIHMCVVCVCAFVCVCV